MQRMIWRGQATATMRKSFPSTMLFKSVETRLLILPMRFPPFPAVAFPSSPLTLVLSASDGVVSEARVVEALSATSVPSGECPEANSETEAVSGVGALVEGRLGGGDDSEGSDFIRMRKACSNTSWVMIPWVCVRTLVCGKLELQSIRHRENCSQ
jgi:hypothetical protein